MGRYEVLSITLVTADKLASAIHPYNHSQHVFIDEADFACGPDCTLHIMPTMSAAS